MLINTPNVLIEWFQTYIIFSEYQKLKYEYIRIVVKTKFKHKFLMFTGICNTNISN